MISYLDDVKQLKEKAQEHMVNYMAKQTLKVANRHSVSVHKVREDLMSAVEESVSDG